jgi:hypothetical protein
VQDDHRARRSRGLIAGSVAPGRSRSAWYRWSASALTLAYLTNDRTDMCRCAPSAVAVREAQGGCKMSPPQAAR